MNIFKYIIILNDLPFKLDVIPVLVLGTGPFTPLYRFEPLAASALSSDEVSTK